MKKIKMIVVLIMLAMITSGTSGQEQQLVLSGSDSSKIAFKQLKRWIEDNVLSVETNYWGGEYFVTISKDTTYHGMVEPPKQFFTIDEIIRYGKGLCANSFIPLPISLYNNWVEEIEFKSKGVFISIQLGEFAINYNCWYGDRGESCTITQKDFFNKVCKRVHIYSDLAKIEGDLKIAPFIFGK